MELCCLGLNYRTAALEVREKFAVPGDALTPTLETLHQESAISEVFVLSTCNRVEVYALAAAGVSTAQTFDRLEKILFLDRGMSRDAVEKHCYRSTGDHALLHLFRVASSLDSMVLGEPQVLGQVKDAWTVARDKGVGGRGLHRIMDRVFRVAKRVRTESRIAHGAVSISFVAVELARRIFADLGQCNVMILGAGEMAELTATHLHEHGAAHVVIANRSSDRAEVIAQKHGWEAKDFAELPELLAQADIVITSTGSVEHILSAEQIQSALEKRHFRPLFIVDIAVPRDVDARAGTIDGVYLYNVDDLEALASRNRESREQEVKQAEALLNEEVQRFRRWLVTQSVSPTIASLRQKLLEIRGAETERTEATLQDLSPEQREAIDRMTMAMVTRFMHEPINRLKESVGGVGGDRMAEIVRELFGLADLDLIANGDEEGASVEEENLGDDGEKEVIRKASGEDT